MFCAMRSCLAFSAASMPELYRLVSRRIGEPVWHLIAAGDLPPERWEVVAGYRANLDEQLCCVRNIGPVLDLDEDTKRLDHAAQRRQKPCHAVFARLRGQGQKEIRLVATSHGVVEWSGLGGVEAQ